MRFLLGPFLAALLATGSTAAAAQQATVSPPANAATLPSNPTTLTGKERLGEKWKDEQRIDDCKVPVEKRGLRPRSDACTHVPMG